MKYLARGCRAPEDRGPRQNIAQQARQREEDRKTWPDSQVQHVCPEN